MYLAVSTALNAVSVLVCAGGEEEEEEDRERACDTLLMCIVTVMNHGLRNGGGVGDVLRKPSKDVRKLPIQQKNKNRQTVLFVCEKPRLVPSSFVTVLPKWEAGFCSPVVLLHFHQLQLNLGVITLS